MTCYYIIDTCENHLTTHNREDFVESLKYNHEIALEYGDEVDDLETIMEHLNNNDDFEEQINGFIYGKTNDIENMSIYW